MGNPRKEKANLGRSQAVERLRALATQIEEGTVVVADRSFPVDQEVRLEIQAEGGELDIELKWKGAAAGA